MFKIERYDIILKILAKKKSVSTDLLCKETYCSPATIRRDLIELEKMGLTTCSHGIASIVLGANSEYSYIFRESEHKKEKSHICSLAKTFILDGSSIFLDSSSTVYHICQFIKDFSDITIVTNGVSTASLTSKIECAKTYISGGCIKYGSNSIIGQSSSEFIKDFKADIAIISCRGLDSDGIYEADQNQALIKQQMIQNAKTTILLCDSSKFNKTFFYRLCSFEKIKAVITEKKPEQPIFDAIKNSGCELLF